MAQHVFIKYSNKAHNDSPFPFHPPLAIATSRPPPTAYTISHKLPARRSVAVTSTCSSPTATAHSFRKAVRIDVADPEARLGKTHSLSLLLGVRNLEPPPTIQ